MTANAEASTRATIWPSSSSVALVALAGCASPKLLVELLVPVDELKSSCAGDIGTGGDGGKLGGGGDGPSAMTNSTVGVPTVRSLSLKEPTD